MKILIISHTYIAPINRDKWKVLANQYQDVDLTVVVPTIWPTHLFTHQAGNLSDEPGTNLRFVPLSVFYPGNEVRYGYGLDALVQVMITCKPDVIQVEQGDNAFSYFQTILLAKFLGIKARICFFTWVNWRPKTSLKYKCSWGLLSKFNQFFSDGAIAGNHDAQVVLRDKGFGKPMVVIPQLGVGVRRSPRWSECNERVEGSDGRKNTIGFIGRITEEKGVMLLVQAFKNLAQNYPDWNLLFVGDGPAKKLLIEYVQQNNLTERVIFKNSVSHHEVAQVFSELSIFVLPSYDTPTWREQFGHVLIEAMACRVPIVASDAGEIPHVVGDAGLIFKQQDEERLRACLVRLMDSEKLRSELSELGYQRMLQNYTHEKIAEKTYKFWLQIRMNIC